MIISAELLIAVAAGGGLLVGGVSMFWWGRRQQHTLNEQARLDTDYWRDQLAHAHEGLQRAQEEQNRLQSAMSAARERLSRLPALEGELRQSQQRNSEQLEENAQLKAQVAGLEVRLDAEQRGFAEKLQLLESSKEQLKAEFQSLAGKIFEENSLRFGRQQQEKLGDLLSPLRDQLGDFRKRVDDVYDKESRDRRGLFEQITQLKQLNQQMSEEALNLTRALKRESKTQGNWGELVLERLLEASGLRAGHEFELQVSLRGEKQARYQPDVIIRLPEQRDVIVDAKVSLLAYERYCSAEDSQARELAIKEHLASLRGHVKGLSGKAYERLPDVRSLDFVLLFVPIEAAFLVALEASPDLFVEAFERNIVLVSPSTLMVTLRTIKNIWRYEQQNAHAQQIAQRGAELHDKFVGFVEALEEVGRHLQLSNRAYETAHKRLVSGKGNLVTRAASLQQLGVTGKKRLPEQLLRQAEDELPIK